jgi:uncharacterized protein YegP (UPF0339 family)
MKNPKYMIKKTADNKFYWERTAANGEGVAYSLPDRFETKQIAEKSIRADIASLLNVLGFKIIYCFSYRSIFFVKAQKMYFLKKMIIISTFEIKDLT